MRFSRPNRRVQDTFPPSESGADVNPSEVSDSVSLTHEFPGREWEKIRSDQLVTTSVVTPNQTVLAATLEEWIEILYGDISHNSATVADLQMTLQSPTGQQIFIGRWTNMETALGLGVPSGFEPVFGPVHGQNAGVASQTVHPPWPLVIPPGWNLRVIGSTEGAAYAITLTIAFIRHFLADRPLAL